METFLKNAQLELLAINNILERMEDWWYLTDEEEEIQKEMKKRKKFLEFLLENA